KESDLYRVLPEDRSETLGKELQRLWDHEVKRATRKPEKPKLTRVLIKCYGKSYVLAGLFVFSQEAIKVIQPLLLGKIILYFENNHPDDHRSLYMAYGYAAAMSISTFALTILQHLYYYHVQRTGMKIRVAMCHMIYRKALGLNCESMARTTTGQIVNLLSNDVNRFDEVTANLHYLWVGPIQAVVIIVLLWDEIGSSCLAGVAVIALMMPLQTWFGKLFGIFRSQTAVLTDSRIRIMNEVVSGIRIIKMYAWEKPFSALVAEVRRTLVIEETSVVIENLTCFWDQSHQLLAVIGPVGSGKSSLLSAILGELPHDTGTLKVEGSLSYASQQPWVFPGTIRSNILFGRELNLQKYERVLRACALKKDLELLPDGDLTLICDRGATLSGGQKARINLARAVYEEADIYLLDDPLSAVDAEVGKHIFEQCIFGLLKNKCRVLVTHQLQHLTAADHILVLKEVCGPLEENDLMKLATASCFLLYPNSKDVMFKFILNGCYVIQCVWSDVFASSSDRAREEYSNSTAAAAGMKNGNVTQSDRELNLTVYLGIYSGLTAAAVVLSYARSLIIFHGLVRSAQILHNRMFSSVVRTPIHFFDVNPIGRILNRFSKDISQVDSLLPITFVDFYQLILQNAGVVAVATAVIPLVLIPVVVLLIIFLYLRRFYLSTSRDIKRLESTTRSPVFSHLSSSLQGLWTIRAFRAEERLKKTFDAHQDLHSEAWFLVLMTSRWFSLCLDSICSVFVFLTTFGCIFLRDGLEAGEVGLVLTYSLTLVGNFQWTMRQSAEVENMMTSVERVVEYTELKSEAPWETQKRPPPDWPSNGLVTFEQVSLSYSTDGPIILKDISATFEPNEKVGIVGRTGAGKSSLISALFRLTEPQGKISIDGVVTSEIDTELNELIQKAIRDKFRECTVLTIAHRLNTIIDSDRILVSPTVCVSETQLIERCHCASFLTFPENFIQICLSVFE
uniref:ATP-binding cassette, sub-family C (CFTR/MRP), member 4 n=1 Tax=Acanthochromis polyacanthus TaxID=80966 RepID=A0A3Q1GLD7_9TELE